MSGIFISYRRRGASKSAYRLKDRLKAEFGADKVFVDVEDIEPGLPFDEVIQKAVDHSTIALIVIGPEWITMTGDDAQPRLHDPEDWVRREVEIALRSDVRVIPLLVDGAPDLDPGQLPESLQPLARLQSRRLSDEETHWHYDVQRLVEVLKQIDPQLSPSSSQPPTPQPEGLPFSGKVIAGLVILAIVIIGVATENADTDTATGAIALGLVGLALSIWGYLDIKAGKARGRPWAITGIVLGVLGTLAGIGIMSSPVSPLPGSSVVATPPPAQPPITAPIQPGTPAGATARNTKDLSGIWVSNEGYAYQISQVGPRIQFVGVDALGQPVAAGSGQIQGETLAIRFTTTDPESPTGAGNFKISAGADRLQGSVSYQPSGVVQALVLKRQ